MKSLPRREGFFTFFIKLRRYKQSEAREENPREFTQK